MGGGGGGGGLSFDGASCFASLTNVHSPVKAEIAVPNPPVAPPSGVKPPSGFGGGDLGGCFASSFPNPPVAPPVVKRPPMTKICPTCGTVIGTFEAFHGRKCISRNEEKIIKKKNQNSSKKRSVIRKDISF